MRRRAFAVLPVALAGCVSFGTESSMCTDEARPGLSIEVRDSVSGAGLAEGTLAIARAGAYADTLSGVGAHVWGAHERPGTYDVSLSRPGFRTWIVSDVRVEQDACHVITERLVARLQPLP